MAFSDGVFAIVITLLVLDLRPPRVKAGQLLRGLLEQWPTYTAYVTSYLYVAVVWLNHKAAFQRIRWLDRGTSWANFGILSRPPCCRSRRRSSPTAWRGANGTTNGWRWRCTP
jgi:uncharacterized membrane protein